jgi:hypothetical protein
MVVCEGVAVVVVVVVVVQAAVAARHGMQATQHKHFMMATTST